MDNVDLLILTHQEKKRKWYISMIFPSIPARTAAGGYAGPSRWGPRLIAGLAAVSFAVLLTGRRLGSA
jgi:hypothetical protein